MARSRYVILEPDKPHDDYSQLAARASRVTFPRRSVGTIKTQNPLEPEMFFVATRMDAEKFNEYDLIKNCFSYNVYFFVGQANYTNIQAIHFDSFKH